VNEHTWELANHLTNVMEKVKKFHQQYPSKPKATPCRTYYKKRIDVTNVNIRHHLLIDGIHP
jgi:hypothetical protein